MKHIQELKPLHSRRYLLRNYCSGDAVAIVEASTAEHAAVRGRLLQTATSLPDDQAELVAEEAGIPMALPTFLDSYFEFLEKVSNTGSKN